jgi:hypothetical protein
VTAVVFERDLPHACLCATYDLPLESRYCQVAVLQGAALDAYAERIEEMRAQVHRTPPASALLLPSIPSMPMLLRHPIARHAAVPPCSHAVMPLAVARVAPRHRPPPSHPLRPPSTPPPPLPPPSQVRELLHGIDRLLCQRGAFHVPTRPSVRRGHAIGYCWILPGELFSMRMDLRPAGTAKPQPRHEELEELAPWRKEIVLMLDRERWQHDRDEWAAAHWRNGAFAFKLGSAAEAGAMPLTLLKVDTPPHLQAEAHVWSYINKRMFYTRWRCFLMMLDVEAEHERRCLRDAGTRVWV